VKYGEKGTEILVAVSATPSALRVAVTNRGVGVAPERMPELFAKFHRIQDPQLRSRKGTGVGLYLVKRIVTQHGGSVGVEGEYGQWIRFWFEVPRAGAAAAAPRPSAAQATPAGPSTTQHQAAAGPPQRD
jgi:signal transduction histidine kinase